MPVVAMIVLASVLATAPPAAPTLQEKAQALSVLVRLQNAEAPDSPSARMYSAAISTAVLAMANVNPNAPDDADNKRLQELLSELKTQNVNVGPAVQSAIEEFQRFGCRSKQSEAKVSLKTLYVSEESYRAEKDAYSKDSNAVGFMPESKRYKVEIVKATATQFLGRATGLADMKGDVWEINEKNELVNTKPLCK